MGIVISNLTKTYGRQKAVDDISFEIETGEVLGFLGPNGAGKSTTMKVITCYVSPTAGEVHLDNLNIRDDARAVRRRIGYLPEDNPLYDDMTIVDYLRLAARLQEVPPRDIQERVRDMISTCGLTPECHKRIGELSKGFQQRVGLAQALIHDPDVLILDEPTTGLDPNQIAEIRRLIREIGQEKTVMLSSHVLKEVEATCDRIVIINAGRLVADSSTEELRRRFRGASRVLAEIHSGEGENAVRQALKQLPSVTEAVPAEGETTTGRWHVDGNPPVDGGNTASVPEQIFHLCAERGWTLTQLTPVESSLEDVFRELTAEEAPVQSEA